MQSRSYRLRYLSGTPLTVIFRESGISGQNPVSANSDCTGQAIVAAIHLDLFLTFSASQTVGLGRNQIGFHLILHRDFSGNFLGIGFFENRLKQFTAGALMLRCLLFQDGKHCPGEGKAVKAGGFITQFLLQMVMDGGSILGRVIINAQKLAVPFCQGIVLQIVQRGERTNDRGLWL